MGRSARVLALGLGVLALAVPMAARAAGYDFEKIALGGELVPQTGGATRANGFTGIDLNDKGHVAFVNELTGGSASFGVFLHSAGSTQTLSLSGESAPGTGGGSYFLPGGFVQLNENDEVSFMAVTTGGSAATGVFVAAVGADTPLVVAGDAAPGTGGVFGTSGSGFSLHSLDDGGAAAFQGDVVGGSAASGLWLALPGPEVALVLAGATAPAGGTYADFDAPSLAASGSFAFPASVSGGPAPAGLFLQQAAGGPGSALLLVGDPAPNTDGGTFADFLLPVLNAEDEVVFLSNVSGGTATGGVFLLTPAAGAIDVAVEDGLAPGTGGGRFAIVPAGPDLNDAGDAVFSAALAGGSADGGIFVRAGASGAISPVVLSGVPAPDSAGASFEQFDLVAINEAGQVAFHTTLSDGTRGVYLASPAPPAVPALGLAGRALLFALLLGSAAGGARRLTRDARPGRAPRA